MISAVALIIGSNVVQAAITLVDVRTQSGITGVHPFPVFLGTYGYRRNLAELCRARTMERSYELR